MNRGENLRIGQVKVLLILIDFLFFTAFEQVDYTRD